LLNEVQDVDRDAVIKGRALVWDMTGDRQNKAYDMLPPDLQALSSDPSITIFLIKEIREEKVGTYGNLKTSAYRKYADIYIIYWPEKTVEGFHTVTGDAPPDEIEYKPGQEPQSVYGDIDTPIFDWIISLPKEG
jgi:hypothetical protein